MATPYIHEIFESINSNTEHLNEYSEITSVQVLLKHAFDPAQKLLLNQEHPEFNLAKEPLGLTPSRLSFESSKLHHFMNDKISDERRQLLFIQMLEVIHPAEARVLIAVKDQKLSEMFPNITKELVASHGLITLEENAISEEAEQIEDNNEKNLDISQEAISNFAAIIQALHTSNKPKPGFSDESSISDEDGFAIEITTEEVKEPEELVVDVNTNEPEVIKAVTDPEKPKTQRRRSVKK